MLVWMKGDVIRTKCSTLFSAIIMVHNGMVKHDPALLSIFQAPLSFGMALYVIFLVTFFTQPVSEHLVIGP